MSRSGGKCLMFPLLCRSGAEPPPRQGRRRGLLRASRCYRDFAVARGPGPGLPRQGALPAPPQRLPSPAPRRQDRSPGRGHDPIRLPRTRPRCFLQRRLPNGLRCWRAVGGYPPRSVSVGKALGRVPRGHRGGARRDWRVTRVAPGTKPKPRQRSRPHPIFFDQMAGCAVKNSSYNVQSENKPGA